MAKLLSTAETLDEDDTVRPIYHASPKFLSVRIVQYLSPIACPAHAAPRSQFTVRAEDKIKGTVTIMKVRSCAQSPRTADKTKMELRA